MHMDNLKGDVITLVASSRKILERRVTCGTGPMEEHIVQPSICLQN